MDEELSGNYRLTREGFERLMRGDVDDLGDGEILIARIFESYEMQELGDVPGEHIIEIMKWFDDTLTQMSLVKMVLGGVLSVMYDEEEKDVSFRLTSVGIDLCRQEGFGDFPELPSLEDE